MNELECEIFIFLSKNFIDLIQVSFYFWLLSRINGTMKIGKNQKKIAHIQLIKTAISKPRFIQIKENNWSYISFEYLK